MKFIKWEKKGNETYVTLCIMLHVQWVNLIIVPYFSFPSSTRLLYIIGSNSSCLWMSSKIEIQNRIVDKLSEFTWFNVETSTSDQSLTTPCSKSEITSLVSIVSITWWLFFFVESSRAWTNKQTKLKIIHSEATHSLAVWIACFGSDHVNCFLWTSLMIYVCLYCQLYAR